MIGRKKSPMMERHAASSSALSWNPNGGGRIGLALRTSISVAVSVLGGLGSGDRRVFARPGLWAQRRRSIFSSTRTSYARPKEWIIVRITIGYGYSCYAPCSFAPARAASAGVTSARRSAGSVGAARASNLSPRTSKWISKARRRLLLKRNMPRGARWPNSARRLSLRSHFPARLPAVRSSTATRTATATRTPRAPWASRGSCTARWWSSSRSSWWLW